MLNIRFSILLSYFRRQIFGAIVMIPERRKTGPTALERMESQRAKRARLSYTSPSTSSETTPQPLSDISNAPAEMHQARSSARSRNYANECPPSPTPAGPRAPSMSNNLLHLAFPKSTLGRQTSDFQDAEELSFRSEFRCCCLSLSLISILILHLSKFQLITLSAC